MTVTGDTTQISDEDLEEYTQFVRMYLRDKVENNILLDEIQFTKDDIRRAISLSTETYNITTPITNYTWDLVPRPLHLLGTCYWLMLSETFIQARNQASVPTDGLGVIGIDDKAPLYQSLANQLKRELRQATKEYKHSRNLERCYGNLPSGYVNVTQYNG